MAAPLDPNSKTRQVIVKVPEAWLAEIDAWRRQQPDIPNVSESIRRLVMMAIEADRARISEVPSLRG